MKNKYDYVIIGSGFGGSVCALRLAEKGHKVLVIEKGKKYEKEDFPRSNWNLKKWIWLPSIRWFGIMKITIFRHISVLTGTGVGGGSLVYGNVLPVPKTPFFTSGSWKGLADWETELSLYYEKALQMLGAEKNPNFGPGDIALRDVAEQIDKKQHFSATTIGVYLGEPEVVSKDPYFEGRGPDRQGCNFCGGCMTGCRYDAKNSTDKNYLYLAQKLGAEIMPGNEVIDVLPLVSGNGKEGYEIKFKRLSGIFRSKGSVTSHGVIFSGGVLGTVKLLLKLKNSSMPDLSEKIGCDIRTNNESLISVTNFDKSINMSEGVGIGSILQTDKDSNIEICRYSNGSGFWRISHLPMTFGNNTIIRIVNMIKDVFLHPIIYFRLLFVRDWGRATTILLFMQTLNSTLRFSSRKSGTLKSSVSTGKAPSAFIPHAGDLARKYEKVVNGKATVFALEPLAGIPSTAHILGGAVMAENPDIGVINSNNEVFGYDNMFVCDGSMISANPGVNPSLTITAISERAMDKIPNNVSTLRKNNL